MIDAPTLTDESAPVLRGRAGGVLGVAVVVAAVAEYGHPTLFDGATPGLGLALLLSLPVVAVIFGRWITGISPTRTSLVYLWSAVLAVAFTAVRAAPELVAIDLAAAVALAALGLYRYRDDAALSLTDHLRVVTSAPFAVAVHPVGFVLEDVDWRMGSAPPRARGIGRGLLIAAVPLFVFGALLSSADPLFGRILTAPFRVRLGTTVPTLIVFVAIAWTVIGLLRYAAGRRPMEVLSRDLPHLGSVEVTAVLGSISLLFATFVIVQFSYLFGGSGTIRATSGLTTAEYYRQGFFQLVVVAGLVAMLLLVLDWWHRPADQHPSRTFAALSLTVLGLTGVMVVSALVRFFIYIDAFGLSRLRVYTFAFVLWIAALLAWFGVTVVRGRRERFALGAVVSAGVIVLALNMINPDGLIARVNIDQAARSGAELDLGHLASLSKDALPALVDGSRDADGPCLAGALGSLAIDLDDAGSGGWRSFRMADLASTDGLAASADVCGLLR